MGHHQHGGAQGVDPLQQAHDLQGPGGVQIPRGLVGDDGAGVVQQGPGDGHPLLLAAGELRGQAAALVGQAHQVQAVGDALFDLLGPGPHRPHGEDHVVVDALVLDEAEILEDDPHRPPQQGDLPLLDVPQGEAVDHHPALGGLHLADEDLDHRALSAARGAHHKDELPVLYLHRQPVEGMDAVGVLLHHVCQSNHSYCFCLPDRGPSLKIMSTSVRKNDKKLHANHT